MCHSGQPQSLHCEHPEPPAGGCQRCHVWAVSPPPRVPESSINPRVHLTQETDEAWGGGGTGPAGAAAVASWTILLPEVRDTADSIGQWESVRLALASVTSFAEDAGLSQVTLSQPRRRTPIPHLGVTHPSPGPGRTYSCHAALCPWAPGRLRTQDRRQDRPTGQTSRRMSQRGCLALLHAHHVVTSGSGALLLPCHPWGGHISQGRDLGLQGGSSLSVCPQWSFLSVHSDRPRLSSRSTLPGWVPLAVHSASLGLSFPSCKAGLA